MHTYILHTYTYTYMLHYSTDLGQLRMWLDCTEQESYLYSVGCVAWAFRQLRHCKSDVVKILLRDHPTWRRLSYTAPKPPSGPPELPSEQALMERQKAAEEAEQAKLKASHRRVHSVFVRREKPVRHSLKLQDTCG